MQKISQKLEVPSSDEIKIIALGDWHWENPNSNHKKIKEILSYIEKTPNTYAILMGDLMDCTQYSGDKRADLSEQRRTFLDTLEVIIDLLRPIQDKIITALTGNHEHRLQTTGYGNPIKHICSELRTPYGGYSCFIRLKGEPKTHRPNLIIYAHHGYFAGRTEGSKVNNLIRTAETIDADVYLFGHSHSLSSIRRVRLGWGGKRNIIFANTGSYLETIKENTLSYSEKYGYPILKTGCIKLIWQPKRSNVYASE